MNMTMGYTPPTMGPASAGDEFYQNKLRELLTNPAAFEQTPGFKAALDTGRQAIERKFAAQGMGNSGNVLAELMKYGTGLASQEYGSTLDRLAGLAGGERSANFAAKESDRGALRDVMGYGLSRDRLALDASNSANQFNLGAFNARTGRGNARTQDWWNWQGA